MYVEDVAPLIFDQVALSGDDCHWYVLFAIVVPVSDKVVVLPTQTLAGVATAEPGMLVLIVTVALVLFADKPLFVQVTTHL